MTNTQKHAVITGGGSGIGLAIAKAFDQEGIKTSIIGRHMERLQEAAATMKHSNPYQLDVTEPGNVMSVVALIEQQQGPIDILVNNAGAASTAPFQKMSYDRWQKMINVNLNGTFLMTQNVLMTMAQRGVGRIINIASTAGLKGYGYSSAYCAAKHGVIGLTKALALELARTKITVNAICPGFTDTDIVEDAIDNIVKKTDRSREEALGELVKYNPQKRLIQPKEVAETVLWLCSPQSRSITGQSIAVAGGEIM
mgnify:CR=1 FL=1